MDLDTALLRAFVATVEENHFGRAAGRLFISQQALSKRVKRLESSLGVQLLNRSSRHVELTDAGRRLLPAARDALAAVDAAAAAVRSGSGPLRVDVLFEYLAPVQWLRTAVEQDPALHVEVSARRNHLDTVTALRHGTFDVAFGRAAVTPWPGDIHRRPAVLEPIGLLVNSDHPFAARQRVSMAELAHTSLFFPTTNAPPDWTDLMRAMTERFGFRVQLPPATVGFEHFLESTAREQAAATLLGRSMPLPDHPRLRLVPLTDPTPVFAWSIMWRPRVPDISVRRLLAGLQHAENTIPADRVGDPQCVWLPDVDRKWWLQWHGRA